ncbi:MAG: hypothetical protein JOY54_21160 [Acidobacteriaceae bacterium]|nr:hypothetical protein [Acidobacteriaceae bacterium]
MKVSACLASSLLTFSILFPARSQDLDRAHASSRHVIVNSANSWQEEAHRSKAAPNSQRALAIRAARDAYIDKVYGLGVPLEQLEEQHLAYRFPNLPLLLGSSEIPAAFRDESVFVGTFDAFDPVLSKSHQTIYEEIHINVERVLYPEQSDLSGSMIDILVPGGTVLLNGQTKSYHTAQQEYGLSPGHRYVLFVEYIPKGDFYLLRDSISLDSGTARPNSPAATSAATAGKWAFTGLSEPALLTRLSAELKKQQHQ